MFKRATAASSLLAIALVAACGSGDSIVGIGYEPLVGQWTAFSYDDEPLPIVQPFNEGGTQCRFETYTLDLAFTEVGRFSSDDNSLMICADQDPVDVSESITGTYRVAASVLYLRESTGPEWGTPFEIVADTLFLIQGTAQGGQVVLKLRKL